MLQPLIELALGHVRDVTEDDLMSTLQHVVSHHRSRASDGDAMQVDEVGTGTGSMDTGVPTIPTFLSWCVTYKTSPSTLRMAIRKHLQDADDLVCLLEVIEGWISTWGARDVEMLPSSPPKKKQDKVTLTGELPPLIKVNVAAQSS